MPYVPRQGGASTSVRTRGEQAYPVRHGPWGAGINNRERDERLQYNELRDAVNVDVLNDGGVRCRPGRRLIQTGRAHSLFCVDDNSMFGVVGTDLLHFHVTPITFTSTVVRSGFALDAPVYYVVAAAKLWYSNGSVHGCYDLTLEQNRAWGVPVPGRPVLSAYPAGGLAAGHYQVTCTFVNDLGEESGASPGVFITVPEGGGVLVSLPATADPTVTFCRVYVTKTNGHQFYHYTSCVTTVRTIVVTASFLGQALETLYLLPPLPGRYLTLYNGRLFYAIGSDLHYTESLRYGATQASNRLPFNKDIACVGAVRNGLFVAETHTGATWFLSGEGPATFTVHRVRNYGAVPGAMLVDPFEDRAMWLTKHGIVVGSSGGEVKAYHEEVLALPAFTHGSLGYVGRDGDRRLVGFLHEGIPHALIHSDFVKGKQIRRLLSSDR